MSIASELTVLAQNKAAIKSAIEAKNPATATTDALAQWPTAIASIPEPKTEQSKTVTPTAAGLTVTPDSGKVLSSVVVNGDADLVPGNIKKDVDIFGVTGTYEGSGGGGLTGHTVTLVADENAARVAIVYADGTAASNVQVEQEEVRTVQNVLAVMTPDSAKKGVTAHVVADGDMFDVFAPCLLEGTQVLLADGSVKPVESVAYSDELAVWDFDEGRMSSARPLWIKVPQESDYFWRSTFRSGRVLETMGHSGHRVFSLDSDRFEYVTECVGHRVALADGSEDVLAETVRVEEPCRYYNLITERHINLYAADILTGCSLENGLYPVRNMRFVKDNRPIRPYVEFKDEVPREWYEGCRYGESLLKHSYLADYWRNRKPLAKQSVEDGY